MKRFHVHLHVNELQKNIDFYSALFNQMPARTESDYAKWMLEDPPVNFAISTRGSTTGLDHLGIQVTSADELANLKVQAQNADMALIDEGETTCCYARSEKYWVTDPQGLAWEQFHTLDNIPVFREVMTAGAVGCCAAVPEEAAPANAASCCAGASLAAPAKEAASCCGPTVSMTTTGQRCCG